MRRIAVLGPPKSSRKEKDLLFTFLLLANFLEYLEAGAVPALLLQLATAFHMAPGQQGLLGGVVYLSLSLGGPFAGYLLRHHDHRTVVGVAVAINNFFTLLWALTPVDLPYSTLMFIVVRFLMGLTQCVICVFLPLWTNQFAPRDKRTSWMGYLQASVPFGIMMGYIIASSVTTLSGGSETCGNIMCWRWPFLIEVILITPLSVAFMFVPKKLISIKIIHSKKEPAKLLTSGSIADHGGGGGGNSMKSGMKRSISNSSFREKSLYQREGKGGDTQPATMIAAIDVPIPPMVPIPVSPTTPSVHANTLHGLSSSGRASATTTSILPPPPTNTSKTAIFSESTQAASFARPSSTAANTPPPPSSQSSSTITSPTLQSSSAFTGVGSGGSSSAAVPLQLVLPGTMPIAASDMMTRSGNINKGAADHRVHDNGKNSVGSTGNSGKKNMTTQSYDEADGDDGKLQTELHLYADDDDDDEDLDERYDNFDDDDDEAWLSPDDAEEQRSRSALRRNTISASLYNAASFKDVLRKSSEDLANLASSDDLLALLPGVRWGSKPFLGRGNSGASTSTAGHSSSTAHSTDNAHYNAGGAGGGTGSASETSNATKSGGDDDNKRLSLSDADIDDNKRLSDADNVGLAFDTDSAGNRSDAAAPNEQQTSSRSRPGGGWLSNLGGFLGYYPPGTKEQLSGRATNGSITWEFDLTTPRSRTTSATSSRPESPALNPLRPFARFSASNNPFGNKPTGSPYSGGVASIADQAGVFTPVSHDRRSSRKMGEESSSQRKGEVEGGQDQGDIGLFLEAPTPRSFPAAGGTRNTTQQATPDDDGDIGADLSSAADERAGSSTGSGGAEQQQQQVVSVGSTSIDGYGRKRESLGESSVHSVGSRESGREASKRQQEQQQQQQQQEGSNRRKSKDRDGRESNSSRRLSAYNGSSGGIGGGKVPVTPKYESLRDAANRYSGARPEESTQRALAKLRKKNAALAKQREILLRLGGQTPGTMTNNSGFGFGDTPYSREPSISSELGLAGSNSVLFVDSVAPEMIGGVVSYGGGGGGGGSAFSSGFNLHDKYGSGNSATGGRGGGQYPVNIVVDKYGSGNSRYYSGSGGGFNYVPDKYGSGTSSTTGGGGGRYSSNFGGGGGGGGLNSSSQQQQDKNASGNSSYNSKYISGRSRGRTTSWRALVEQAAAAEANQETLDNHRKNNSSSNPAAESGHEHYHHHSQHHKHHHQHSGGRTAHRQQPLTGDHATSSPPPPSEDASSYSESASEEGEEEGFDDRDPNNNHRGGGGGGGYGHEKSSSSSPSASSAKTMMESVKALLRIPVYRYLLAAMAALYFTVTGVQYWGTSYMRVTMHAPLPLVNALFILCAATGPTTGVFVGGWVVDLCGGYKGAAQRVKALEVCCIFGALGCFFATPVTFIGNIYGVVVLLWLVLFCGGAVLPACSGIVVSVVPRKHRPMSSSLSLVVFNMFGYCLSLVLSGYLMQILSTYRDCNQGCMLTWGFRLVLFWSYWSILFLGLALYASHRALDKKRNNLSAGGHSTASSSSYATQFVSIRSGTGWRLDHRDTDDEGEEGEEEDFPSGAGSRGTYSTANSRGNSAIFDITPYGSLQETASVPANDRSGDTASSSSAAQSKSLVSSLIGSFWMLGRTRSVAAASVVDVPPQASSRTNLSSSSQQGSSTGTGTGAGSTYFSYGSIPGTTNNRKGTQTASYTKGSSGAAQRALIEPSYDDAEGEERERGRMPLSIAVMEVPQGIRRKRSLLNFWS